MGLQFDSLILTRFLLYDILSLASNQKTRRIQKYVNLLSLVSYWVELAVCVLICILG